MVKVKICGVKREEDIKFVNIYLPDYVGYVFAQSRRQITVDQVLSLNSVLDNKIKKVGVFVNEKEDTVVAIAQICHLDIVQLSGDESPEYTDNLRNRLEQLKIQCNRRVEIWKAIRVTGINSLETMRIYNVDKYLLDSNTKESYGGSGITFDWKLVGHYLKHRKKNHTGGNMEIGKKIIIAGGLNPQNVDQAIKIANPYGVDVSSGVEISGIKDEGKISDFIKIVRNG